jgi:hypothetical protein
VEILFEANTPNLGGSRCGIRFDPRGLRSRDFWSRRIGHKGALRRLRVNDENKKRR